MNSVTFKGTPINIHGSLPQMGEKVSDFTLVKSDLSEVHLFSLKGKKILNIFPSLDTGVCAASVENFEKKSSALGDAILLNISKDLPFAHKRFCESKGIKKGETLSAFRSSFGKEYGMEITEGPLKGLLARSVLVLDEDNRVVYAELVPEITQEPNYNKAVEALAL